LPTPIGPPPLSFSLVKFFQIDHKKKRQHGETPSFFSSRKRTFQFLTQQDLSRSQLGNKLLWIVKMIWNRLNALFPAMMNRPPPYCHYISKNRPKKGHKRPNSPSGAALISGLGGVEIKICQFRNSIRSFSSS